jgi:uncharacterized protein (DUF924 family)
MDAEAILQFWFGDAADDPVKARARESFWFGASAKADRTIRERFLPTIEAAGRGELSAWLNDPRSALALIVALDQFPLNAWRGTAKAYDFATAALDAAKRAVAAGHPVRLTPVENAFLILPYQHSESIGDQRESVRLSTEFLNAAPPGWQLLMERYLWFARQHHDIIERFGRFPHRNRVLGRASTQEELDYLASGGPTFGQG